jgi:hypothetical protein
MGDSTPKVRLITTAPSRIITPFVREAVTKAIADNLPFIMVARCPNGEWESSCFLPPSLIYEAIGAMEHWKMHSLMEIDNDEEEYDDC